MDPANILFSSSTLNRSSCVMELGCGVSPILALALASSVGRYIATDQGYSSILFLKNLKDNAKQPSVPRKKHSPFRGSVPCICPIEYMPLDWELSALDDLPALMRSSDEEIPALDVLVACDCVYNEALVGPFVRTCAEICSLLNTRASRKPPICIVAQQLRSDSVFESWLKAFRVSFRVWRVPNELLTGALKEGSGFVVHIGVLHGAGLLVKGGLLSID